MKEYLWHEHSAWARTGILVHCASHFVGYRCILILEAKPDKLTMRRPKWQVFDASHPAGLFSHCTASPTPVICPFKRRNRALMSRQTEHAMVSGPGMPLVARCPHGCQTMATPVSWCQSFCSALSSVPLKGKGKPSKGEQSMCCQAMLTQRA